MKFVNPFGSQRKLVQGGELPRKGHETRKKQKGKNDLVPNVLILK